MSVLDHSTSLLILCFFLSNNHIYILRNIIILEHCEGHVFAHETHRDIGRRDLLLSSAPERTHRMQNQVAQ